ncbi:serine/threonine-protein kinase [Frigidibacter oleivorans]|uniref:serine/threonine-protein kinase n=1 Tax=Frigidibacter oleivorans TaxID=2487129 RepID=UPI0013DFC55D|nr:serine/threonine-protein kinase [Frigidibacter oleivorans]
MTNEPPVPPGDAPRGASVAPGSAAEGDRRVTAVTAGTQIIGTYEIEQLISSGGMGEVYRGRNIHNGEPVAIKIVLPSLAHDPKIVALFQKEATVLGRLSHDAIVRYHVFTNDPAIGRPSLIMEFVAGQSLSDRLDQGPMPLEDVTVLMRRLASGLDKAHRAGVVHRDLSPDNVILEDGFVEHAKIIDFGIAKSSTIGGGTLLQGQFAGKFNFVSPEQLGAFGGVVDGRSDIYSLALLIAAACRGAVVPMGSSIVDAVGKRASVPAIDGLPEALRPLIEHMLEPDPAHRPETMAEVIRMLDTPALVPSRVAPPAMPDPNRTVIAGSLPPVSLPPELGGGRLTGGFGAAAAGGQTTGVPAGGRQTTGARGSLPVDEGDSPFGAPASAPASASAASAAPARSGGGMGMLVAVLLVLIAAGAGGAWFTGLLGGPGEGETDLAAAEDPAPAAEPEPAADPAPEIAPEPTTEPPAATATDPEPAAPSAPEPAAPAPAAPDAAPATAAAPEAPATAEPDPAPPPPGAGPPPAGEPPLAAEPTDPLAWIAAHETPACVALLPAEAGAAVTAVAAAEADLAPARAAYDSRFPDGPTVQTQIVETTQCPIVDFAKDHRAAPEALPLLRLSGEGSFASGALVSGELAGVGDRAAELFLVNGAGGATNLRNFIAKSSDGTISFSFTVNLADGAPAGQMLLAIVTDQPLTKLAVVPDGVTARALMPFIATQLDETGQTVAPVFRAFRIE